MVFSCIYIYNIAYIATANNYVAFPFSAVLNQTTQHYTCYSILVSIRYMSLMSAMTSLAEGRSSLSSFKHR